MKISSRFLFVCFLALIALVFLVAPRSVSPVAAQGDATEAPTMAAGDELVVGFVLVGPKTDKGWSEAHFQGSEYMKAKVPGVKTLVVEALDPNITLAQIVQGMKEEGAKVIFTTSDFFQEDTTKLAEENPDITFINVSGDAVHKGTAPANLGNVMGKMEFGKMIGGCAAALASEKNSIAYVGPLINDETRRLVVSAYLGARYCAETYRKVDPKDLKFGVTWIGFWFNKPGETLDPTEVTNGYFDGGADVIMSGLDTPEVITIANQRVEKGEKVFAVPYDYSDACSIGPKACLGVPYFNWGPAYTKIISDIKAGTWKSSWDWLDPDWKDLNNPDTTNVGFITGDALPADQKANLDAFIADLASGKVNLFTGPLKYADGTEYLADGKEATEDQIWYMPQLIEGINEVKKES
jgi:simple sugar transport system substrate-binding protein